MSTIVEFRVLAALPATVLMLLLNTPSSAQSPHARTYCNPVDIDCKYNFEQLNEGISYRSGADPVIVNHKGGYGRPRLLCRHRGL